MIQVQYTRVFELVCDYFEILDLVFLKKKNTIIFLTDILFLEQHRQLPYVLSRYCVVLLFQQPDICMV